MDQERLSERISSVISQVMDSFSENKYIDKENTFRHPDEQDVLTVLDELRQLVFRGFFAHTRYKVFTAQNHTSMLLEDILYHLSKQIELVLPYDEAQFGAASPEELTEAAMGKALDFLEALPAIRSLLETDLDAAFDGDPAAFTRDEIIFSYPGLYAIFTYRIAHELYRLDVPLIPRMMTEHAHRETGIDIHPGATIGHHFFIDHGTGIVIGETTHIGNYVKVYQGVTLGALSTSGGRLMNNVRRHPTLEDRVTIYAGASILGGGTVIGTGSVIGSNCFITSSVPAGSRVLN